MSYFEREAKAKAKTGATVEYIAACLRCDAARVERALLGEHVVRVVLPGPGGPKAGEENMASFLRCLEQAHLIKVHRDEVSGMCYDILPPLDVDSDDWAKRVAKFMEDRGFNAVAAPRWPDEA